MQTTGRVLGVDACKAGWVGIALGAPEPQAYVAADIESLVRRAEQQGPLAVVAIDIPIGLPDTGQRRADDLARAAIGPRWPSVFMTPVRLALKAPDHPTASKINRKLAGKGISVQAFGLKVKLFEVERFASHDSHVVIEVHPEVSFAQMAGHSLTSRKSTWAGAERRRELLREHGIALSGDLGLAGWNAGVDDVLDAGAAAWSARRFAAGEAISLPDPPEQFDDGWPAAIWV
jgi:predicted RNase H-like nuclease